MGEFIGYLIVTLAILILIFIIFRELNNWYWKINERIKLQKKTNFLLEKIALKLGVEESKIEEYEKEETESKKEITDDGFLDTGEEYKPTP